MLIIAFDICRKISIHAPHEGSDGNIGGGGQHLYRISIHAPHEGERLFGTAEDGVPVLFQSTLPTRGSDALYASCRRWRSSFQSTLPTRGSDLLRSARWCTLRHFNPRSPRGGATDIQYKRQRRIPISIHAPHEGERLGGSKSMGKKVKISIHAPHEGERRTSAHGASAHNSNFNPRSPRGGATAQTAPQLRCDRKFQSTLPTRGSDGP